MAICSDEREARNEAMRLLGRNPVRPQDMVSVDVVVHVLVQPRDEGLTVRELGETAIEAVLNAAPFRRETGAPVSPARPSLPVCEPGGRRGELANGGRSSCKSASGLPEGRRTLMNVPVPDIRIGEPLTCGGVTAYPLFAGSHGSVDYVLAAEAMTNGTLTVQEVSESGEVPWLVADNDGDLPVLFFEGEVLRGGKQDRALASSVLVARTSRTRVPVCCVERGRWRHSSRRFSPGSCCPPSLRSFLKQGDSRQSLVWAAIRRRHGATGTESLSNALDARREAAEGARHGLRYVRGASGIAVAVGEKIVGIDIFDKPKTCKPFWDRLAESAVLDAQEMPIAARRASGSDVAVKLYMMQDVRWQRLDPVGLGESYRGAATTAPWRPPWSRATRSSTWACPRRPD